jgi:hypothetical protein
MLIAAIASTTALAAPAGEPGGQKVALGLTAPAPDSVWRVGEDTDRLQLRGHGVSYGGVREIPRLGPYSVESYSGVFQPLSGRWGSSLEIGVSRDSPIGAPRYSLGGQLHTAFLPGHGLNLGLKLSGAERAAPGADLTGRLDPPGAPDGLLADRPSGNSSYELNVNYLYGKRYSVGMTYQQSIAGHFYAPYGSTPGLRSFALTGQQWLTPNWSMSYDIYASDPAALLQSPGFGLGLRYRF